MNSSVAATGVSVRKDADDQPVSMHLPSPPVSVVDNDPGSIRARREVLNGHRRAVLWFTGLSGSGKSTLAQAVEEVLLRSGCRTFVLDGDNIRRGLCADLDFSRAGRAENIRRVGQVAKLFAESGTIVLVAFISPFAHDRDQVRALLAPGEFVEVYCDCSLAVCELRDVKGLYKRARRGEVENFTAVSSLYEVPENPDIVINTATRPLSAGVGQVVAFLQD